MRVVISQVDQFTDIGFSLVQAGDRHPQRILDRGFDAVKMKLGLPDPREDYARVKAVRKAIGDIRPRPQTTSG
ncbi:MAG: hypothetical protein EBX67_07505 [Betaproteobacteria bacterium]|nr:hypothetical protein [Betaproteobacteria bacterium]